jgi:PIN domain nuclease of toxin-antitoxin system
VNLLVDTHALLWFLAGDAQLSTPARQAIEDRANDVRVSVASLWEIVIKHSIGKLTLTEGIDGLMRAAFVDATFERMNIEPEHLEELSRLPYLRHHRDPFDRLLVAQARAEAATLVTIERWWNNGYRVTVLW